MSSSLNSVTPRRAFLLALLSLPAWSLASGTPLDGLQRWGSGQYRRFGFLIYEASLWGGERAELLPPYALRLTYKRNIKGRQLAESSVDEMRRFNLADENLLKQWGERLLKLFPDVQPEDHITGLHLPQGSRFYLNDQEIGRIDDPVLSRAFFAIWLDARTSAPDLRAALLRRTAG